MVSSATGDEEVGVLGSNLRGVVLLQDIPHLSHLGALPHAAWRARPAHAGRAWRLVRPAP